MGFAHSQIVNNETFLGLPPLPLGWFNGRKKKKFFSFFLSLPREDEVRGVRITPTPFPLFFGAVPNKLILGQFCGMLQLVMFRVFMPGMVHVCW